MLICSNTYEQYTNTHTHTRIYIYIYIYIGLKLFKNSVRITFIPKPAYVPLHNVYSLTAPPILYTSLSLSLSFFFILLICLSLYLHRLTSVLSTQNYFSSLKKMHWDFIVSPRHVVPMLFLHKALTHNLRPFSFL